MRQEFERWEVLVHERRRIGVLYRSLESNVLLTRVLLEAGNGPYAAESRLRLDPEADSWELSWYRDRSLDTAKLMRREALGLPTASMPSFGGFLMLMKAVRAPGVPLAYWRLNESAWDARDAIGHLGPEPNARIQHVGGPEELEIPLGATVVAQRYESRVVGSPVATHWVNEDNELVCSRWSEAMTSYRVPGDASEAGWLSLSGLDERTIEFMTRGFDAGT